ncbi:MAG: hypothetical protein FJ279_15660 [Planctomycetes bacterium]|nr:hypothetical protein [Planctomycetota bacterium]
MADWQRKWLSMPDETEAKILEWARRFPDLVRLDAEKQFCGRTAYAVTVTDPRLPDGPKKKHLFAVPHAHEPGATAGCMSFMNQVITGQHLDGQPTDLDRDRILRESLLTFIPDANPDGRSRSPERWWDGSKWPNEEFWCWMRGKDPHTGKMWKRLDLWSTREEKDYPSPVGIVYEQVSEHEYVEPNRSPRSSLLKLIARLRQRHEYDQFLDLHQTEFEKSPHDTMVILPIMQLELSPEMQSRNQRLAEAIVSAWKAIGANPIPAIKPLGYGEPHRTYFIRCWGDMYHKVAIATSEVQNNNPRTPPPRQLLYTETAMRASVTHLLAETKRP